jgi:hypothetical protein
MPKLPGVNHLRAISAFEKAGFRIIRQSKHITMTNGERIITLPRANPINAYRKNGSKALSFRTTFLVVPKSCRRVAVRL